MRSKLSMTGLCTTAPSRCFCDGSISHFCSLITSLFQDSHLTEKLLRLRYLLLSRCIDDDEIEYLLLTSLDPSTANGDV